MILTFAQFESDLASERTKDKMLERAKRGMWNGSLVSYGYIRQNKKLVINPLLLLREVQRPQKFFSSFRDCVD